ncbi:hypothetical protein [Maribacter sp. ACAM166]|uniref:hypothetical protein n=1 Tax=Maribacter sp. ACAM166 TaxID=2508996 RepID=UPI0010FF4E36|nr:hypothetical protein [Maribacter sp. ACAM166]TLP80130.1 hypothetical protein ES765_09110 [Maribacter sp. ACAM166]
MKENIFKQIETDKKLPEEAKEELVSNIETAKLFQSFTELFGTEYLSVLKDFFKNDKKEE